MSKTVKLVLVAVVVVAALAAAGVWWFLKDDAPEEVSLGAAVEAVEDGTDAATDSTSAGAEGSTTDDGVSGTWTVVADPAAFSFDESDQGTYVGFRVNEELTSIGSATAVGRTPQVAGEITIDGTTLTDATFEADMTAITTNESRRDSRVQSALETSSFPTATFTLTEPVDLGAAAADGDPVAVAAVGELTIHGITRSVEIALEAQLTGDTVVVVGQLEITFADYDVEVPSAPVVVSAEDHGIIEVQLLLTR